MPKKFQISILLLFLFWRAGVSQHNVDFQIPSQVCLGQSINIQNTSDAGNAEWNFCSSLNGAYSSSPKGTVSASLSGLSMVENNGLWYGFAVARNNQLYKLDFGSNPNTTYVVTSMGNPGGLFNSPDGIKIIKSKGKW